jgi:hypothetical protein
MAAPNRTSDHGGSGFARFAPSVNLKSAGAYYVNEQQNWTRKSQTHYEHQSGVAGAKRCDLFLPILQCF